MNDRLRNTEFAVAVLLTLTAISVRVVAAFSAGALWRDEANTVGLATLPTLRDVWRSLQFDSFPLLWIIIVREFSHFAGSMNDPAFRILGFGIGVGLIAALWFYARSFHYSLPLASLALLGLCPSVVTWGDSMRAYGFGMLLIIITGAVLWRFVEEPRSRRFAIAAVLATASVQTIFYNSVIVLAFCTGATAVCARRNRWQTAASVVAIGAVAAISMTPYVSTIASASTWNMLVQIPNFTFLRFWAKLYEALRPGGPWTLVVWAEAFVLCLVAAARAIRYPTELGHTIRQQDVALFSAVTLVVGSIGIFVFLRTLSYPTQPWYYLALLAMSAMCIDSITGSLAHSARARTARLAAIVIFGALSIIPAVRSASERMTTADIVASRLKTLAQPTDFVVVNPWFVGVTFSRYYRGSASWGTAPPVGYYRFHRFDRIKEWMTAADQESPIRSLKSAISATLRGGHTVFVAGGLPVTSAPEKIMPLHPAPLRGNEWPVDIYDATWSLLVGDFVRDHAMRIIVLPLGSNLKVNEFETLALIEVTGWHD